MGINLEGQKEVIGFYIGESETSKMWLNLLNDIKTRCCEKIFLISCDNLPGISNAIKARYPNTDIKKCDVHQNRNNVKFFNYKELKPFTLDMKKIYGASNY